jgi:hypothetical protein
MDVCCGFLLLLFYLFLFIIFFSWIFIMLVHWNNNPWIDMSLHSDTLSWFRTNQSLFFLLNDACLAEKQQVPILKSLVWLDRGSNPWSTTLEPSMLTVTILAFNDNFFFWQNMAKHILSFVTQIQFFSFCTVKKCFTTNSCQFKTAYFKFKYYQD